MRKLFHNSKTEVFSIEDREIVTLFFKRDQDAIKETEKKYGGYCNSIAFNILSSREDAEECVNDALINAWNSIPPHYPSVLRTYLGRLTRNAGLKRLRDMNRQKRGNGEIALCYEELGECIADCSDGYEKLEAKELASFINGFLSELPIHEQRAFVLRYWYFEQVADIANRLGFSASKVKSMLYRTRQRLSERLQEEGINIEGR